MVGEGRFGTLGGSRTHNLWFLRPAPLTVGLREHLVLLVGVEPTRKLVLNQPPLPVGLQEQEMEKLNRPKHD